MSVKINIPPGLRRFTHDREAAEVSGNTVGECLEQLARQFPGIEGEFLDEDGSVFQYVDIYVNGVSSYPEELAKAVKDGDEIYILREIAGG